MSLFNYVTLICHNYVTITCRSKLSQQRVAIIFVSHLTHLNFGILHIFYFVIKIGQNYLLAPKNSWFCTYLSPSSCAMAEHLIYSITVTVHFQYNRVKSATLSQFQNHLIVKNELQSYLYLL